MNTKKMKIVGATLPWRLSRDQLTKALEDLPIHVEGTKDLVLKASVSGAKVRIAPKQGRITRYSLHNIRNPKIYPENGETYVLFKYHGINYELGTTNNL